MPRSKKKMPRPRCSRVTGEVRTVILFAKVKMEELDRQHPWDRRRRWPGFRMLLRKHKRGAAKGEVRTLPTGETECSLRQHDADNTWELGITALT